MTFRNETDRLLGMWELQPELSEYQLGVPPQSGLYMISRKGDQYLFAVAWKTADGQEMSASFSGIPDGRRRPYENSQAADEVSFTQIDERTLDSASFKNGQQIAHARRELIEGGRRLRVTQSGQLPGGESFANISYYVKSV